MSRLLASTKILLIIALALLIVFLCTFLKSSVFALIVIAVCFAALFRFGLFAFNMPPRQFFKDNQELVKVLSSLSFAILLILFFILVRKSDFSDVEFKPIAYVNSHEETIWSWGEDKKYVYININDAKSGELIDTIKFNRKLLPGRIDIVQGNSDIWVISTAKWKPGFAQAFDLQTYERTINLDDVFIKNDIDKDAVADVVFPYREFGNFTHADNRIMQIRTVQEQYFYFDVITGNFYQGKNEFYLDFCLQNMKYYEELEDDLSDEKYTIEVIYADSEYVVFYFLVYENDKVSPIVDILKYPTNSHSSDMQHIHEINFSDNENFNEKFSLEILKQGNDNYCNIFDLSPCVFKIGYELFIRVITLGTYIFNLNSLDISFEQERVFFDCKYHIPRVTYVLTETKNSNIYKVFATRNKKMRSDFYNYDIPVHKNESIISDNNEFVELLPDKELILPKILFQNNNYAVIVYYTRLGKNPQYEMAIVSSANEELFRMKCSDFPSHSLMIENESSENPGSDTKIIDLMKYFSWRDNLKFYPDGDNLVILFAKYGAIKIDLKRNKLIWKYEIV